MPELKNTSFKLLDWYKSIGIDICVQNSPRKRFKSIKVNNKENIYPDKINNLKDLEKQIYKFNGSELKTTATKLVFGDGNPNSKIMLIGEAPGYEEDKSGFPFVGAAGKKLDQMINAIGLSRKKNVYITNIVPWRPPNNRTPSENEILIFLPYVEKHISIINPDIIILLGNVAAKAILKNNEGITKIHGNWFNYKNPYLKKIINIICIFHPSFLLRSPGQKKHAWDDLKKVEKKINELKLKINEKN